MYAPDTTPPLVRKIRGNKYTAHIYLLLVFASFFILSFGFEQIYLSVLNFGKETLVVPKTFNIAWCLIFTGIIWILPPIPKKLFMMLIISFYVLMVIADGVMLNIFSRFFSFSDLSFAGDGAEFMDGSYFQVRTQTISLCIASFLLMLLAAILSPVRKTQHGWLPYVCGGVLVVAGIIIATNVKTQYLRAEKVVVWNGSDTPVDIADIFQDYNDTKQATMISGIYEYSFRSLCQSIGIFNGVSLEDKYEAKNYITARPGHEANDMTGILEGKNLIMVQLEAIDTWMLSEKYMPNLYGIKQDSIQFANHFTPAYITAGTFNTEFMANTGLFPATTGTSISVYTENAYPYSLPNLFRNAGYSANSFHNSEGNVYDRENVHVTLGYEAYHSGSDMGMEDFSLDSQLMSGYEEMTKADKFCTFIITISGHGPYNEYSTPSNLHMDAAKAVAERQDENYVHAVAHAMETDAFIGKLYERLAADGLLDNTVLVFYADHYNYYMLDDPMLMEIKNAPNFNMLAHTDFFIYSKGTEPMKVNKVTSSVDVTPTLANLFGFDVDLRNYLGSDAFSDDGGYVIFPDGAWYDGKTYWDPSKPSDEHTDKINKEIELRQNVSQTVLITDYFAEKTDKKG